MEWGKSYWLCGLDSQQLLHAVYFDPITRLIINFGHGPMLPSTMPFSTAHYILFTVGTSTLEMVEQIRGPSEIFQCKRTAQKC